MRESPSGTRLRELLRSPGGCALLIKAASNGLTPAAIVEPVTALHLVSTCIGEINPFYGYRDRVVERLLREGPRHRDLAVALLREPGIERWWASLERDGQVWIESESRNPFPTGETFPTPQGPPSGHEIYAQHPKIWVSTSTEIDGWTSQLADLTSGMGDSHMNYAARRARVRVEPSARVLEIDSAEAWHAMAVAHGVRSRPDQSPHPSNWHGLPWGSNDGIVPDWPAIAGEWDGVHLTLWAYLTATQVRIESDAGWSMAWSWEGEQTCWLNWAFDDVEDLPVLERLQEEDRRFWYLEGPGELPWQMEFRAADGEQLWWTRSTPPDEE